LKKRMVLTLIALFLLVGKAEAAPNGFKDVISSGAKGKFKVELAFDRTPKAIINYYEKSIQLDVVDGYVTPARRTFSINRPDIKSINVYQVKPRLLRVRILPGSGGMEALKESFSFTSNGTALVFGVGKKSGASARASAILTPKPEIASKIPSSAEEPTSDSELSAKNTPAITEEATTPTPGEAINGGEDFLANIRKNLDEIKKEAPVDTNKSATDDPKAQLASFPAAAQSAAAPSQAPGLGEAFLKIGSALLIVLALIFVISFVVKKYMGTMENALGTKKQLKVLSNHFIGVKKNVTIIEVGGEILVLGVSNSNVNLLAHYSDPEKIELIRLAHRLPDRPMGLFKRFGVFDRIGKKKEAQPVNSQFARQAASYAENIKQTMAERAEENDDKPTSRAATVASTISAARALKARLRSLEGTS